MEYITGMDTRVGYPSEHLAGDTQESVSSPLFATAVGLLMNALEHSNPSEVSCVNENIDDKTEEEDTPIKDINVARKSILDRFGERLKEFLDNA